MNLFSLLAAFLLERLRPLDVAKFVTAPLAGVARSLESRFNAGEPRHGAIAWLLGVIPAAVVTLAAYFALRAVHPLLGWACNVAVLYWAMGFCHHSRLFAAIRIALRDGDLDRARSLLAQWRGRSAERVSTNEVARLAIEQGLLAAHRHVFAVVVWFIILPGPSGALLYRLADCFSQRWGMRDDAEFGAFGDFARLAFALIDWLPVRISAWGFAIVGNFEDAMLCWRTQACRWPDKGSGILLASGAGALGVRLGMAVFESGAISERAELGLGEDADADFMQSTMGLVWRTLVLCLLLLTLFGVAGWVGN